MCVCVCVQFTVMFSTVTFLTAKRYIYITLHCTWFDLVDAFGSISHSLISHTLLRNEIPPEIQSCIKTLYSSLCATVVTPSWSSSPFSISHGMFQGDPLSHSFLYTALTLFLSIKTEFFRWLQFSKHSHYHRTLPYADDFDLII